MSVVTFLWRLCTIFTVLESYRGSLALGKLGFVCFGLRMRIDSRFQNLSNAGFNAGFSDSFNTITLKMLALKVDNVGEGLRTRPES